MGSSNAVLTTNRRLSIVMSRMSTPSIVMRPPVTSYNRGISETNVVFPLPVAPAMASVSPG